MSRIREESVGSGITRHTSRRLVLDGPVEPGDVDALRSSIAAAAKANKPWVWLEREKAIAERTLAAIVAGERDDDGERIFEPHHGAGWYSEKILYHIGHIERARERGDVEGACRDSAMLAELALTIRMKGAWDKDVEVGIKVAKAGEDSRKGRTAGERIRAINGLRANGARPGVAIATIASEDGVTVQAVEKQYYKKRPTGVSRE
jgi:hypothetical protein